MTATTIAAVVVGTCLAGFVQGVSGFAFGLVAVSVWAWSIEPQLAGPLVVDAPYLFWSEVWQAYRWEPGYCLISTCTCFEQ